MVRIFRTPVLIATALSSLALAFGALPAAADPPNPAAVTIAGVGSDTTQDVMNTLATAYNATGPGQVLGSYDATPVGTTITTKAGCPSITRPNGSSAGISALLNDTTGCIDFARSSRPKGTAAGEAGLAFFAYARDGVTWATFPSGKPALTPTSLTAAQLASIYRCNVTNWKQIQASLPANPIHPFLPQVGSGTRSFFLSAIGITDSLVGACVTQGVEENDGRAIAKDKLAVVPYSIAKWIAQSKKLPADIRGGVKLGKISGIAPTVKNASGVALNPAFPSSFLRLVYNVVKKNGAGQVDARYTGIFGAGGFICSRQDLITKYGFASIGGACGSVS